ncbi:hypothetical protein GCM10027047_01090 [Rhodococcus aerolatus]
MKVPCPQCLSNVTLVDPGSAERTRWQTLALADHTARVAPGTEPELCGASGRPYQDVAADQPDGE